VSAFLLAVVEAILVLAFIGLNAFVLIWLERKLAGHIQRRIVSFTPAVLVFLVIPFGPRLVIQDMNVALVFIAAVTSFTLLAVFMAGWGSNNKYSLLGAMRAGAQLFSYEIPLILSTIGVVLASGSLSLRTIVERQAHGWFLLPQIVGFVVFYISALAETNRTPFDMSEAESELVAGYFTEYSGIRWSMFAFAEYAALFTSSAVATALFLGGWYPPAWLPVRFVPPVVWFLGKTYLLVLIAIWIRWTLPRVRIDQMLDLGWKFLLPVSLANILGTGLYLAVVR
jgi:NADH-quinone oxidoreductase subunit H